MAKRRCKYCSAILTRSIDIVKRDLKVADVSYDVDLEVELANVPASIKTLSRISKFNGTNTESNSSHLFVIRFVDGIEEVNTIFYNKKIFVIDGIINFDEEDKWLEIYTTERGIATAVNGVTNKVNFK